MLSASHIKKFQWSYLIIFILFSLVMFWPSLLGDPFWDDWVFIFKAYRGQMSSHNPMIFFPGGSEAKSWPVFYSAIWMMLKVFKEHYFFYHLTSIFFHGINGFLIWIILKKTHIKNSMFWSLIYLAHPINLFTVSWIIQFKTLLSISFFLCSIFFILKFYHKKNLILYFSSLIFFLLSIGTKSTTVGLGACILTSYPLFKKRMSASRFFALFVAPIILLCFIGTMLTIRSYNTKGYVLKGITEKSAELLNYDTGTTPLQFNESLKPGEQLFYFISPVDKILLSTKIFSRYVQFLVMPFGGDHLFQERTEIKYLSYEFILAFLTLAGLYTLLKYLFHKKLFFELMGVVFFLATLLPFCGLFFLPIFSFSNFIPYWLSIPALGLIPLASHLIRSKFILVASIVVLAGLTHWQSYQFINTEELFVESIKKDSSNVILQVALIEHYVNTYQCEKAEQLFDKFKTNHDTNQFNIKIKVKGCDSQRKDAK